MEQFKPNDNARVRALAMYAAAITLSEPNIMADAIVFAGRHDVDRAELYEVVLQSYLFLGFPRMLDAAENLSAALPHRNNEPSPAPISASEAATWFDNGVALCRRVYGEKYEPLMKRVSEMAPEIFRWMIVEGYGKVLSRPGLSAIDRELCIVAFLIMENRVKQLRSHILGALNVGADLDLVRSVIEDIGPAAGDGFASAMSIIKGLE